MTVAFERRLNEAIRGLAGSRSLRDGDVKTASLVTLTDMFLDQVRLGASELPEQFGVLMLGLLPRVCVETRAEVSRRLAHTEVLPRCVLELLMADEPQVAGPVLRQSPLLTPDDLLAVARGGSAAKARAIAGRAGLPDNAVAALIDRRDPAIGSEITLSETLRLDGGAADRLARIPDLSPAAATRLAEIPGLSDESLLTLFWQIDAEHRRLVLERVLRRRDHMAMPDPAASRAVLGEELVRLAARRAPEIPGRLGAELHLPAALAARVVEDEGGEALVVAGRAAGLSVEHVTGLVLLATPHAAETLDTLRALASLAIRLAPPIAGHMVEIWRRQATLPARHDAAVSRPPERPRPAAQSEPRRLESIVAEYADRRRG